MPVVLRLLGESPAIAAVREQAERLLRSAASPGRRPPPVLILGETGTGKGLLADAIHRAGGRAGGPFVDVNCAAIPETLLEAELFGFERGAFTDARQAKAGLFQAARGGTVFLDEIGLLPLALQAKLLKVIEERAVRRLGSTRSEAVDAAVIAATSEDLTAAVERGRFRADLYHRLAVVTLVLPPLRARGRDVVLLAEHFLARACEDYRLPPRALGDDACAALLAHAWPGNVRELANVIERAALFADERVLTAAALALPVRGARARSGRAAVRRRRDRGRRAPRSARRPHLRGLELHARGRPARRAPQHAPLPGGAAGARAGRRRGAARRPACRASRTFRGAHAGARGPARDPARDAPRDAPRAGAP